MVSDWRSGGFRPDEGVISPGGVGYDINCGVRLLSTRLEVKEVRSRLREVVERLFRDVPTGSVPPVS